MISADVLTRRHRFSLLFLLGLISNPDEHLKWERCKHTVCLSFMPLTMLYIHIVQLKYQSAGFFTCSQVSRIMTSSVARSSWVISPGTSSIWEKERDLGELCTKGFEAFRNWHIYILETTRFLFSLIHSNYPPKNLWFLWIIQSNCEIISGKFLIRSSQCSFQTLLPEGFTSVKWSICPVKLKYSRIRAK